MRSAMLVLAACGGGHAVIDGPIDTHHIDTYQIPATIQIDGVVSSLAGATRTPAAGVTVAAYDNNGTARATATTSEAGAFTLAVATNGIPVGVHLKTSASTYNDTYLYFPENYLAADAHGVAVDVVTPTAYAQIYSSTGVAHTAGTAMFELTAIGTFGGPESGATFMPASGTVVYTVNGAPDKTASYTASDGIGFVLDAPVGVSEMYAQGLETYFMPASIEGFADALTMQHIMAMFGGD